MYKHHLFWDLYSAKMREHIKTATHGRKCEGFAFSREKLGISYKLDFTYDESTEMFSSFSYMIKGPSFMIALLEGLADLVLQKPVKETAFIRAEELLETLSIYEVANVYNDEDISDYISFLSPFVNHVIDSYCFVVEKLVPHKFVTPEALQSFSVDGDGIENFFEFSKEQQISMIERVMEKDIQPYVALDDGSVKVKDLTKNGIVLIEYGGNCTSCHAAGSTTLSAITSILKAKIHNSIEVLPYMS